MTEEPEKFCCRCKEEFSVMEDDNKYRGWRMGQLRHLKYAPLKIRRQFREWLNSEIHGEGYLCGNCFFDLTD